jgi:riboflavin kinase / FMN adenylyltransferase
MRGKMQVHSHWQSLAAGARGCSVAMGNFDGVHRGHQSVIDLARGADPLGVVTFEPHPREYFSPGAASFRLMNAEARANRLAKLGVAHLFELPFDAEMAGLSPEAFVKEVLVGGLQVRQVGMGADLGFGVTIAPLIDHAGREISSTAIRQALAVGNPREAAAMLGHLHRIEGEVIHGEKRGRELGYPTANMSVAGLHLPRFGVYAVKVDVLGGPQAGSYLGAASLGVRPQFGGAVPNLETFIFDFKGDLYGQHLSVALVEYLRPEMKFDGLQGLLDQMAADCLRARALLTEA